MSDVDTKYQIVVNDEGNLARVSCIYLLVTEERFMLRAVYSLGELLGPVLIFSFLSSLCTAVLCIWSKVIFATKAECYP